jgi:hypothetical protein
MRTPVLELLWWEGCPSTERALAELRKVLTDVGLSGAPVTLREIRTDAQAATLRFPGSPTILVDGADIAPVPADEPGSLTCRVYMRRDGRVSPIPDPDDLRDALSAAMGQREEVRR